MVEKWQMKFNIEKCKILHLGRSNLLNQYQIYGVVDQKDLGFKVSRDLKDGRQCSKAGNKENRILGLIT